MKHYIATYDTPHGSIGISIEANNINEADIMAKCYASEAKLVHIRTIEASNE